MEKKNVENIFKISLKFVYWLLGCCWLIGHPSIGIWIDVESNFVLFVNLVNTGGECRFLCAFYNATIKYGWSVYVSVQGNSSFYVKLFALYYCYEHDCFYIYLICVGRIILQMKNRKKVEQNQEGKSVLVYAITANRSTAKRVRYVENNFQWHL